LVVAVPDAPIVVVAPVVAVGAKVRVPADAVTGPPVTVTGPCQG